MDLKCGSNSNFRKKIFKEKYEKLNFQEKEQGRWESRECFYGKKISHVEKYYW